MTVLVIDASVTLSWCFEDEVDAIAEQTLSALEAGEGLVPSLWRLEIVNGLVVAERRKRLRANQSDHFLQLLAVLPIRVDDQTSALAVLDLARKTNLSAYDAAYLELALRRDVPLATRDRVLVAAARKAGVRLFDG